jgi:hypothetical protein
MTNGVPDQLTPLGYESPPELRAGAVVIRHDKRIGAGVAVAGAVLIGIGLYSRLYPGFLNEWWFFAFGGFTLVAGLWLLLDPRPKLVVEPVAFHDLKTGLGELPWDQIAGVRTAEFDHGPYLYIRLIDADLARSKVSAAGRWKFPRPTDAADDEVTVPLAGLGMKPAELVALMEQRRAAAR